MRLEVTDREFHTILAALRLWQRQQAVPGASDCDAIATDGGSVEALDDAEIDDLCEKINVEGGNG